MEAMEQLKSKLHDIFLQLPAENLCTERTKRYFGALRSLSTAMTYTVCCDPEVVQIIATSDCIDYTNSALNLITDGLQTFLKKNFADPNVSNFITLYAILWNVTDKSYDVCNRFVLAELYVPIWKLLSRDDLFNIFHKYTNSRLLVHCSLGILHNLLCYCPRVRDEYRNLSGVKILEPYISDSYAAANDFLTSLKSVALFVLAAILNENEDVSIITTDRRVLTYVLSALEDSLQSPPDYYSTRYGYHAAEIFACLGCLAGPETNKRNLFENNTLDLISTALRISMEVKQGSLKVANENEYFSRDFYQFSEDRLANEAIDLLWHLSCLPEAKDMLKESSELYKLCARFNDSRWTLECRKSVQALLCSLSQQRTWLEHSDPSMITTSPKPRGHVMISYNNKAQDLVVALKEALASLGWNLWIFTEHCHHGSFLEQMATAVLDSAALIVMLSSYYNDSQHCIKEAISAYEYRIPLLPVVVESNYVPTNFLRLLLAGAQPVQLLDTTQAEEAAETLSERLISYGVMRESVSMVPKPLPVPSGSAPLIRFGRGHQRSRSDCLLGGTVTGWGREVSQSCVSTKASSSMTPRAQSPTVHIQIPVQCKPANSTHRSGVPDRLALPPSSSSPSHPGVQRGESDYFTSTPYINDTVPYSSVSGGSVGGVHSASCAGAARLPAALESYLSAQVPSPSVRGWPEERVLAWLAEHSLAHHAQAFARISGVQLYELAWQRIRGCDSFFRNLAGMHMPLSEQLLLSAALASLHDYPD